MKPIGQAIREELRRFERRRLRPFFHRFRLRPSALLSAEAPAAPHARPPEPTQPLEELLIALVRAELRRRPAASPDAGSGGVSADLLREAGGTDAERLVRSLLATPHVPAAGHEARGEAA